jgi:TRAP-type C4-dicarboxylate transport system substrate-binding protein
MRTVISRRGLIAVAAAATAVTTFSIRRGLAAAAYEYKYGTNVPATHPLSARAQEAADAIANETDGRFLLRVFPNNQLGGDTDMLSQLRFGGLEFFSPEPSRPALSASNRLCASSAI